MSRAPILLTHRHRMSRYYGFHSNIYDVTRWIFLFGRERIIEELKLCPGETVIEVGSGTGHNFGRIISRVDSHGRLIAADCSQPMLKRANTRVRRNGWKNVTVLDREYGLEPVNEGQTDAVLMSYSISMIPNWQTALRCAKAELKPGGRVGIVDFWFGELGKASDGFANWLRLNHVEVDRPYENVLTTMFRSPDLRTRNAFGGLWKYFRFIGAK